MRNHVIYWGVYALLLPGGMAVSGLRVLPVANTAVFLLGLYWLWHGLSRILRLDPYENRRYTRRADAALSLLAMGLGLAWAAIALTPYSLRGLPMAAVSLPFLIPALTVFLRRRRG